MSATDVGVLSLGVPDQGVVSEKYRDAVRREDVLLNALRTAGLTVASGGAPFPEVDRIATSSSMLRTHIHTLVDARARCFILNATAGARGADATEAVRYLQQRTQEPCRLVLFADDSAPAFPLAAVVQVGAVLRRAGHPHFVFTGDPDDEIDMSVLLERLAFLCRRQAAHREVLEAVRVLTRQKLLCFGPAGSRLTGETLEGDALARSFGVNVHTTRRDALDVRSSELGADAAAEQEIVDPRLRRCHAHLMRRLPDCAPAVERHVFRQVSLYLAASDLLREADATLATICFEDTWTGDELAAALLSDDLDPEGRHEDPLPTAPDGDVLTAVTMRTLGLVTGAPARFVRWVAGGADEGLAIDLSSAPDVAEATVEQAASRRLLSGLVPDPGTEVTLARWERSAGGHVLHMVEECVSEARTSIPGRCQIRFSTPGWDLLHCWPASTAALCPGAWMAHLAELAHILQLPFVCHGQ